MNPHSSTPHCREVAEKLVLAVVMHDYHWLTTDKGESAYGVLQGQAAGRVAQLLADSFPDHTEARELLERMKPVIKSTIPLLQLLDILSDNKSVRGAAKSTIATFDALLQQENLDSNATAGTSRPEKGSATDTEGKLSAGESPAESTNLALTKAALALMTPAFLHLLAEAELDIEQINLVRKHAGKPPCGSDAVNEAREVVERLGLTKMKP
jgi:hypothetical protein